MWAITWPFFRGKCSQGVSQIYRFGDRYTGAAPILKRIANILSIVGEARLSSLTFTRIFPLISQISGVPAVGGFTETYQNLSHRWILRLQIDGFEKNLHTITIISSYPKYMCSLYYSSNMSTVYPQHILSYITNKMYTLKTSQMITTHGPNKCKAIYIHSIK